MSPVTTKRPTTSWQRQVGIAVCTLLLQLPLFGWFWLDFGDAKATVTRERSRRPAMKGRFIRRQPPKKEEEQVEEPPEDAQVVEVTQEPTKPEPKEKVKPKLLADRTVRTKKQTRSRNSSRPNRSKRPGKVQPKKVSKVQSKDATSSKETSLKTKNKQLALMQKKDKLRKSNKGEAPKRSVLHYGDKAKLFLPSTSGRAERHNLQAASGSMATDDVLKDIKPGKSTLLNADKYKFSDFFYRVKDAVRRKWHPNAVYRRRDPSGKLYGVKDRHTVLRVTLDARGRLKKLVTRKHSGLDFMDAEARSAFKRAQPFPNPPTGLVRDGKVRFDFGFYFEISSGRSKFRWRQL